jgi:16S rRNA A1518/A1519 N6-dimethyltransferase RsmA/KsgA/DIM1 with predicted DNA glycosylase/AP lyase activity
MTSVTKVNFASLSSEYLDPSSLQYKKLRLVDQYISKTDSLLGIGAGTGEFTKLELHKFNELYGTDADQEFLKIYMERFNNDFLRKKIHVLGKCCTIIAQKMPSRKQE